MAKLEFLVQEWSLSLGGEARGQPDVAAELTVWRVDALGSAAHHGATASAERLESRTQTITFYFVRPGAPLPATEVRAIEDGARSRAHATVYLRAELLGAAIAALASGSPTEVSADDERAPGAGISAFIQARAPRQRPPVAPVMVVAGSLLGPA